MSICILSNYLKKRYTIKFDSYLPEIETTFKTIKKQKQKQKVKKKKHKTKKKKTNKQVIGNRYNLISRISNTHTFKFCI